MTADFKEYQQSANKDNWQGYYSDVVKKETNEK
jgi:hypothetical protein